MSTPRATSLYFFKTIGPGILIAATGVGAGDLAASAFAGSKLGVAVLWAVLLGALIKYVITEGLARWQLATGQTLIEGAILRLGAVAQYFFLSYFLIWTFGVGSSLISACGVAGYALFPVFENPEEGKVIFGIGHSIVGLALVWVGTYRFFERLMGLCVGIMFVLVVVTAVLVAPSWTEVVVGLAVPSIPSYVENGFDQGVGWTFALMGGVGGTLTVISYNYWIRERGREGSDWLTTCRIDLMVAYAVTALFGIAVVIIASESNLERMASAELIVALANQLEEPLGPTGRYIFLMGAWAAIFSSLLGVWQSVPYMFADYWRIAALRRRGGARNSASGKIETRGRLYRTYLITLACVPMLGLMYDFEILQKLNSIYGALVMPMIALVLFILNGRADWVGKMKNRPITSLALIAILGFFGYIGAPALYRQIAEWF